MSDKTIRVARGDEVDLRVIGREAPDAVTDKEDRGPKGSPEPVLDDDLLVFRRKPEIEFLDLGTRLRSVPPETVFDRLRVRPRGEISSPVSDDSWFNEYVEVSVAAGQDVNDHVLQATDVTEFDAELLGDRVGSSDTLDPLGTSEANVSGRKVPNCMPLPYRSEWLWTDAVLYDEDGETRHVLGKGGERQHVDGDVGDPPQDSDKWKKGPKLPADENWNPLNVSAKTAGEQGTLRAPFAGKHLRVDAATHYERLDTGDASRYRWTEEPSFVASEVAVPTLSGTKVRVFLRPKIVQVSVGMQTEFNNGFMTGGVVPSVVTRLPVYPSIGKLSWIAKFANDRRNYRITREFSRAMSASLERTPELIEGRDAGEAIAFVLFGATSVVARRHGIYVHADFLHPGATEGQLVGIVEIRGQAYYGWLKADDDTTDRRINLLAGEVVTNLNPQCSMPSDEWFLTPHFLYVGADDTTDTAPNPGNVYQEPIL